MEPPDMILGDFLVRLAVDDNLRASFEFAPKDTLNGLSPRLKPEVEDAILRRRKNTLFNLFNIANQSSGGDVAGKKGKKKTAKKSSPNS
jgi:hypothetical protein